MEIWLLHLLDEFVLIISDQYSISLVPCTTCTRKLRGPHGTLARLTVSTEETPMSEIVTIMRWAKCKSKDWKHEKPGLLQQYGWLPVARKIRGKFDEFVRRRLKQPIKRAGGQAAPHKTFPRMPPGDSIVRSELRAWVCQMFRRAKSSLPLGEQQRWMDSLSIVQGRGTIADNILVNGSKY